MFEDKLKRYDELEKHIDHERKHEDLQNRIDLAERVWGIKHENIT